MANVKNNALDVKQYKLINNIVNITTIAVILLINLAIVALLNSIKRYRSLYRILFSFPEYIDHL
jgi:hypothetical protein